MIRLIDHDLAARLEAVACLFFISQTIWEMWLIRNWHVFQGQFIRFLATKMTILMVERMNVLCFGGVSSRSKIRIMRGIVIL